MTGWKAWSTSRQVINRVRADETPTLHPWGPVVGLGAVPDGFGVGAARCVGVLIIQGDGCRLPSVQVSTQPRTIQSPPNATGVGARELCNDTTLTAQRGIHVVVDNVGIDEFWMEAVADPIWTSIFPFPSHIILGGAALSEDGPSDDDAAAAILARAVDKEPALATASVLGRQVGWRPTRETPRVEREDVDGTPCVHAYGHGGIGVTVSWGVAKDVVKMLNQYGA